MNGMLESEEQYYTDYQIRTRDESYDLGYLIGILSWVIPLVRSGRKREKPGAEELYDYINGEGLKKERYEDIQSFIRKYPSLDCERLARRIWKESEYWHGTMITHS